MESCYMNRKLLRQISPPFLPPPPPQFPPFPLPTRHSPFTFSSVPFVPFYGYLVVSNDLVMYIHTHTFNPANRHAVFAEVAPVPV